MDFLCGSVDKYSNAIKNAFEIFDKNNDGKISIKELTEVLQTFGYTYSTESMIEMMSEVDLINRDGAIDITEFEVKFTHFLVLFPLVKGVYTFKELKDAFKAFERIDDDNDGLLSPLEVKKIMLTIGINPTEAYIQKLLFDFDQNRDKMINFNEFLEYLIR